MKRDLFEFVFLVVLISCAVITALSLVVWP